MKKVHITGNDKIADAKWTLTDAVAVFVLVFIVMIVLYKLFGYAPFGNNSLATLDANIQYLDFFCYFQDVLKGKNSIVFTFSNLLGGNNIGTYSYYLASPFNFLVVFFDKTEMHTFFDLLVALKIAVAGATFSVFLHGRFKEVFKGGKRARFFTILLSMGYALSQYNIAQSSNIMWLDGVYMLPLILLGVYYVVRDHSGWKLSLFAGMSILFGWYSAGISCLFSGIWIFFEMALKMCGEHYDSVFQALRKNYGYFVRYFISMLTGILISAVLFYPTVLAMRNSSRGGLDFGELKNQGFIGSLPSVVQSYALGAKSSYGSVSLFCGSLALIGCISCFTTKRISAKMRAVLGIMLGTMVMLFYWYPCYFVFSLFKYADSYWYRYSYVGIFTVLFLAAVFYLNMYSETDGIQIWKVGAFFAGALVLLDYLKPSQDRKLTYYTAFAALLTGGLLSFCIGGINRRRIYKMKMYGILGGFVVFELAYGTKLQMYNYHVSDIAEYKNYVNETELVIQNILEQEDETVFRISQTSTRRHNRNLNATANYNEALAFRYASIASYTSVPDSRQINLLGHMGYRCAIDRITEVNTCILGADSLLGVKYVLSEYPIVGLNESEVISPAGSKTVFENPYYLPFAFTYDAVEYDEDDNLNPFEYQNALYSQLGGAEVKLYRPLDFSVRQEDGNGSLIYEISVFEGNYAVYGNIPWRKNINAVIDVNHIYKTAYARWNSPSVFYIPVDCTGGDTKAVLEFYASDLDGIIHGDEQFYALDLAALDKISKLLRNRKADSVSVKNGSVSFSVNTDRPMELFVSIPYDEGWTITNNGEKIGTGLFADCMYSIPLNEGENIIEMTYRLPGLNLGIVGTVIGILCTLGAGFAEREKLKNRKNN